MLRAVLFLSACLASVDAWAKPKLGAADPDWGRHQAIYRAAEANMERGYWDVALERLNMLLKMGVETASVRYYRAFCHANLKLWVEAYRDFGRALSVGDPAVSEDMAVAKESYTKMLEVKKHLGWLLVSAGPLPEGERPLVLVDGEPAQAEGGALEPVSSYFTWPPIAVARGEHTVEVRAAGRKPVQKKVVVEDDGQDAARPFESLGPMVSVGFASFEAASPSPAPALLRAQGASASERASSRPAAPLSLTLRGAGLALGATSTGLVAAHFLDRSEGRGDSLLVAGLVTGSAAVVTGVVALLLGGDSGVKADRGVQRGNDAPPSRLGGHVRLMPTPQGVGLAW